eukprot:177942-Pyramimonas_sp.AAC.1
MPSDAEGFVGYLLVRCVGQSRCERHIWRRRHYTALRDLALRYMVDVSRRCERRTRPSGARHGHMAPRPCRALAPEAMLGAPECAAGDSLTPSDGR